MSERWSIPVGLAGAGAAIVVWASDLTLVQTGTEVDKRWNEEFASNNAYWARDLRWMALVAVVAGLVLALRGDRRWSARAALVVVGLIGVDLVVDRLDLDGGVANGALLAAVCALILTAWLFARRGTDPDRIPVILAASVAAATAPLAAGIESPSDSEFALTLLALVTGGLLVAMMVACAVAAMPDRSRARLVAVCVFAVVGGASVPLMRMIEPGARALPFFLLGGVLLVGVAIMVCPWRRGTWTTVGVLIFAYPVLLLLTVIVIGFWLPVAKLFTAAAGSPPVNSADTDLLVTLIGVLPGLVLGGLVAAVSRPRPRWVPHTSDRLPA